MHHYRRRLVGLWRGIGDQEFALTLGFGIKAARHVEAGERQPRIETLLGRCIGRRQDQRILALDEALLLVLVPFLDVEQRAHRHRRALGRDAGGRQRQPTGLPDDDFFGRDLDADVIGVGADGDAMSRIEQCEIDEILSLDEAAHRWQRGDHDQRVAGIGIDDPMRETERRKRHRDVGECGIGDVAHHRQRQRRRFHRVGQDQGPFCPARTRIAGQRIHLRTVEANADRLPLLQRLADDVADDGAAFDADRLDVERVCGIEHQPDRVAAAERSRRRWSRKGECQAQTVAVAPDADRGWISRLRIRRRCCGQLLRRFDSGRLRRLHGGLYCLGGRPVHLHRRLWAFNNSGRFGFCRRCLGLFRSSDPGFPVLCNRCGLCLSGKGLRASQAGFATSLTAGAATSGLASAFMVSEIGGLISSE